MPEVERHLEFKQTLMRGVLRPVGHKRQILAADPAEHVITILFHLAQSLLLCDLFLVALVPVFPSLFWLYINKFTWLRILIHKCTVLDSYIRKLSLSITNVRTCLTLIAEPDEELSLF